MIRKTNPRV